MSTTDPDLPALPDDTPYRSSLADVQEVQEAETPPEPLHEEQGYHADAALDEEREPTPPAVPAYFRLADNPADRQQANRQPVAPDRRGSSWMPRVLLVAVGALVVIALLGLGAIGLRGVISRPTTTSITSVASHPTATVVLTATVVPTMPNFSVPNGKLQFDATFAPTTSLTCNATAALPAQTIMLVNGGNVAVDWWIEVKDKLPDKTLWAGVSPPYGTLPAGQSLQVQLQPDESLCGQIIGHPGSVKYTAIIHDGGTDQATLTDTVTPPPPGTAAATPTPVPTPIPTPILGK